MSNKLIIRKLNNTFSRGKMLELTPGKAATAKVSLLADEIFDGLEFAQQYGFISSPPVDSEILAAFLGGNRDHGTILNAFKRDLIPDDLEEGDVCIYGKNGERIMIDATGNMLINNANVDIIIASDGAITISTTEAITLDTPSLSITGSVNIVGDLTVGGTINGEVFPPP